MEFLNGSLWDSCFVGKVFSWIVLPVFITYCIINRMRESCILSGLFLVAGKVCHRVVPLAIYFLGVGMLPWKLCFIVCVVDRGDIFKRFGEVILLKQEANLFIALSSFFFVI